MFWTCTPVGLRAAVLELCSQVLCSVTQDSVTRFVNIVQTHEMVFRDHVPSSKYCPAPSMKSGAAESRPFAGLLVHLQHTHESSMPPKMESLTNCKSLSLHVLGLKL